MGIFSRRWRTEKKGKTPGGEPLLRIWQYYSLYGRIPSLHFRNAKFKVNGKSNGLNSRDKNGKNDEGDGGIKEKAKLGMLT